MIEHGKKSHRPSEHRRTGDADGCGSPPTTGLAQKLEQGCANPDWQAGERIAKYLARAGIASRREIEKLIARGAVRVDGHCLTSPAFKVVGGEDIRIDGQRVMASQPVRLWRYHKPVGLITTTRDTKGRRTVFDALPKNLPRTITVGRLDLTTQGLLLLTNDGELARAMELPSSGFVRSYRARAYGAVTQGDLDRLSKGITLKDGTVYAPIRAVLERRSGANSWIGLRLSEGRNREVRKALAYLGLNVNRLIRTCYGPFELADLLSGAVEEVPQKDVDDLVRMIDIRRRQRDPKQKKPG